MFYEATSFTFNSDISKWGVSRVTGMNGVFYEATSFNGDISKWDVSAVINMNNMFMGATSFKQKLCGTAWIHSKASKNLMFEGSPAWINITNSVHFGHHNHRIVLATIEITAQKCF